MSKWKWIVAGRRAVLAVRRLLRRDVGSWRPAEGENCRRQIPLPAPCQQPIGTSKYMVYHQFFATRRILSLLDGDSQGEQ